MCQSRLITHCTLVTFQQTAFFWGRGVWVFFVFVASTRRLTVDRYSMSVCPVYALCMSLPHSTHPGLRLSPWPFHAQSTWHLLDKAPPRNVSCITVIASCTFLQAPLNHHPRMFDATCRRYRLMCNASLPGSLITWIAVPVGSKICHNVFFCVNAVVPRGIHVVASLGLLFIRPLGVVQTLLGQVE